MGVALLPACDDPPVAGTVPERRGAPAISSDVFAIPLDCTRYIIYAPLRRAALVANAPTVNFLVDLKQGRYDKSLDPDGSLTEVLRRLEILDAGPERLPITPFTGDPKPTAVTLFLTTACNLRCTYCYAHAGDKSPRSMSLDTAKRAIDFAAANAVSKGETTFEIGYHGGGEPTANWRVMTQSLEYARWKASRLNLSVTASCATNGVLRDQQIDWIVQKLGSVSLSFDGLPEVQDACRVTPLGGGSSRRVMHTIRRLDEARFNYGIRMTVTRDHIPSLPDSVEFICANFQPQRVQIEPAYNLGRWSGAASAETEEFIAAYRQAQARAAKFGRDICYSAARLDTLTNHFCAVSQGSFAVSPDGNVSACYEAFSEDSALADVFFYGKPDDWGGYRFDLEALDKLRAQTVEHREYCRGCFAKWHCAGDCYYKALVSNRRGEFAGTARCHITRELTKDQILARIAASGGLFWHAPPTEDETRVPQAKEIL